MIHSLYRRHAETSHADQFPKRVISQENYSRVSVDESAAAFAALCLVREKEFRKSPSFTSNFTISNAMGKLQRSLQMRKYALRVQI
jgi:hypothetical protein